MEQRFHTPQPVELDVRIPAGDIVIETIAGEESTVIVEGNEKLMEQTHVELQGNRLVVEFRGNKPFGITIEIGGWRIGNERLRVHARVPHASRASVQTASADGHVSGRVSDIEVRTVSGDFAVVAEVERDATVKTISGDVRFQNVVHGDLQVQTTSGDLWAARVDGSLSVKSVSGDVRVDALREGKATVQSVSGDITLGVERGTTVDVDANSVSGDLASEFEIGDEIGHDETGPTLVVRGKTVSGDFRLTRA
ncbi:MAG: DUF4097 family beta strand repeat-containing protein [Actinomycetota bacterium]